MTLGKKRLSTSAVNDEICTCADGLHVRNCCLSFQLYKNIQNILKQNRCLYLVSNVLQIVHVLVHCTVLRYNTTVLYVLQYCISKNPHEMNVHQVCSRQLVKSARKSLKKYPSIVINRSFNANCAKLLRGEHEDELIGALESENALR